MSQGEDFSPLPLGSPRLSPPLPTSPPSGNGRRSTPSVGSPLNPYTDRSLTRTPLNRRGSTSSSSGEGHDQYAGGSAGGSKHNSRHMSRNSHSSGNLLDAASLGILSGAVGGNFGPFPRSSTYSSYAAGQAPFNRRDSMASSDVAIDLSPHEHAFMPSASYSRYSAASDSEGSLGLHGLAALPDSPGLEGYKRTSHSRGSLEPNQALLWDKENAEADDYLHDPDPELDRMLDKQWAHFSARGLFNVGVLSTLIIVLVGLFAGWPIYRYVIVGGFPSNGAANMGYNIGGINGSGQVPEINGLPNLIDITTPASALSRTGFDGEQYSLVFSDEFNTDGRTFWPGDDPWWEAVDLHYWATDDLEWYDPDAITTKDGKLEITLSEEPIHGLNFRSGMLQSWNKLCFTGGYIEVSMSMPGTSKMQGFWPAAWTMGNLGRAGYGSSVDGMWPYSYDTCDVGTLPNQTFPNGTWPTAAKTSGSTDYGGELSYLPGQRASACTCPGEDHPGPDVSKGRGAPEIDINEMQVDYRGTGSTSQSIQVAPMDAGYAWKNSTPYIQIWDAVNTFQNLWHGAIYQESMSVITLTDETSYDGAGYSTFGYEYDPGPNGRITWAFNGNQTWQLNSDAMGPNDEAQIGQRVVSEEPMYINLNLAISTKFQYPEWGKLTFPGVLRFDYVRVYQKGTPQIGCSPPSMPTEDYINNHLDLYMNPNMTVFTESNYTYPRNQLSAKGCTG